MKYADVNVGDELTPLAVPLTRTLIVATAIASRDYQNVHHDPEHALCDGPQALLPSEMASLADELIRVAEAVGRPTNR